MDNSTCPCCGYKTFDPDDRGGYGICPICYWEDDPIQSNDIEYVGGANKVSLKQARRNYVAFGAAKKEMVKNVCKPNQDVEKDLE